MRILIFLTPVVLVSGFFISCYGASSGRSAMLSSLSADSSSPPPPEAVSQPTPDNPEEFNYFPYDLQLDTIAYMTCDSSTFFTLRAGSYFKRSGLRLSDYFLRQDLNDDNLIKLIESSTKHNARPILKFGLISNTIQRLWENSANFNIKLKDHLKILSENGQKRLRDLHNDPVTADMKTTPHYPIQWSAQNGKMILHYLNPKNEPIYQAQAGESPNLYGRIYDLRFEENLSGISALQSISEEKRPVDEDDIEWICPENLRLEVRKNENNAYDAREWYDSAKRSDSDYAGLYPTFADAQRSEHIGHRPGDSEPICEDSSDGGHYEAIVRKILGDRWNINIAIGCISSKNSKLGCYRQHGGHKRQKPVISYDDPRCERPDTRNSDKICPHQLSICVRKN